MTRPFADKVALVTGASSGIGLAVARRLVAGGARVALVARTESTLREAALSLGGDEHAWAVPLDVKDLDALALLPGRVVERFGALDVLVNNAGVNHRGPLFDRTAAELAEVVHVNLAAPIALCRAAVPLLRAGGSIVNVASLAGMVPVHHQAAYSASKAGLRAFSRAARDELQPRGITVSLVSPGPVDTNFFGDLEKVPALVFSQPMKTADEVAAAVVECIETGREEIALPWLSGKLATLGYVSPALLRALRPMLLRRGERNKRAYIARRR